MIQGLLLALVLTSPGLAQDPCTQPECPAVRDVSLALDGAIRAGQGPAQPFFAPFDDVEQQVLSLLDGARREVIVAHYNIRREAILEKLVALSKRGVRVRVAVDETNAGHTWNVGDDFLEQNGIELLRTKPDGRQALMHLKVCVIDEQIVMTGSFNWNATAALANDENMLVVRDAALARAYRGQVLEILGDDSARFDGGKVGDFFELHFAPEERLDSLLAAQLRRAKESIDIAMFGLTERKVQDELVRALQRGVQVRIVTEQKQAGSTALDEKVEEAGAQVVRASNRVGAYSAMHHKYAVIDGQRVLTGACNWTKNGTRYSDEDVLIVESQALAGQYEDNFKDLLHVYGDIDSPSDRAAAPIMFHTEHSGTALGDRVVAVGSDPALGSWDPHRGVELSTSDDLFPAWAGHVRLPAGADVEYKFVTIRPDGSVDWEPGANRRLHVPDSGRAVVSESNYGDTSTSWGPSSHKALTAAIPDYLQRQADGSYRSPGGLVYGADASYGNRAAHVLDHLAESGEKSSQGVYTIGRDEVFPLVDEAYDRIKANPDRYHVEDQGKRSVYDVPVGREIGYVGGQEGTTARVSTLRVVLQGGDELVTAFPVAP